MSSDREAGTEAQATVPVVQSGEVALKRVMETIMRMLLVSTGATVCQLMFHEESELRVRARATQERDIAVEFGSSIKPEPLSLFIGRSVLRTGAPLMVDVKAHCHELAGSSARDCLPHTGFGIPLYAERNLIAVLYLQSNRPSSAFSPEKRTLIELMASQIGTSLAHAIGQSSLDDEKQLWGITENQLRHARDELLEASCATNTGELLASIIHELSQPLSAIDASTGAGLRWLQRDVPSLDEVKISLDKVRSCTARAKKSIDGLRALIRQPDRSFFRFDVHAAIREVVLLSRKRIDDHRAQVTFTGMDFMGPVLGNRMQIQQVVQHLLANALDAISHVTDRPRIITISSEAGRGQGIVISVANSGPGISQVHREELFLPFVTTKTHGMGIGLSVCKRIIEAHGGELWHDNAEPHGTRFSFMLDRARDDCNSGPVFHSQPEC
ncbi:ATP-binding protein [Burkholderia sp. Ac-20365]|uniref:ATP-binding protein n=1 Tax=Burkholderia sp. Ac-20365 TaxID=2703897 RepID=UPI00197BEDEA|nr:ATP-binding protein [Burkholderia sp. Ac-20365]MBN3761570.1 GAF domain-containing protein [Burkholderia sp. Ac-20365]